MFLLVKAVIYNMLDLFSFFIDGLKLIGAEVNFNFD